MGSPPAGPSVEGGGNRAGHLENMIAYFPGAVNLPANFEKFLYTNGFSCAILYRVHVPAVPPGVPERSRRGGFPRRCCVFFQGGTRFPAGQIIKGLFTDKLQQGPFSGPEWFSYPDATGRSQTSAGGTGPGGQRAPLLAMPSAGWERCRYIFLSLKEF